jgi:hypothetical protein
MSPSQLVAYQQEVERARQVEGYFDPQYFEEIKGFTVPWKVVKDGEVSEVGVNAGEMYKKVQESLNWVAKMMQCMGGK